MTFTFLEKEPGDDLPFNTDFTGAPILDPLAGNDTLASATTTASPSGLTIGAASVSGKMIVNRISGGVDGTQYIVTCTALTTGGYTLVGQWYLTVKVAKPA